MTKCDICNEPVVMESLTECDDCGSMMCIECGSYKSPYMCIECSELNEEYEDE